MVTFPCKSDGSFKVYIVRTSKNSPGTSWSTCCGILKLHHTLFQEKVQQSHDAHDPLNFEYL